MTSAAEFEKLYGFPITWRQLIICFVIAFLPDALVSIADYQGWLVVSAYRLINPLGAVGFILALAAYGAMNRQRWAVWPLFATAVLLQNLITNDMRLTREIAQRELMLLEVCDAPASSSASRAQCMEAGIRPNRVMCDFGKQPDECLQDLYRDAGWPQPDASIEQQAANSEGTPR